jgi:four helix bundle protein
MVRDVRRVADAVARFDRDHARQLRKASMSVSLNLGEGSGSRGGIRRARYDTALGSARETLVGLEAAEAAGYIGPMPSEVRARFDHIIGTLVNLVR